MSHSRLDEDATVGEQGSSIAAQGHGWPGFSETRWKAGGPGGAGRVECQMKVKASVRRVCGQCQIVRRKGKVRVICKADPKHKQVQG